MQGAGQTICGRSSKLAQQEVLNEINCGRATQAVIEYGTQAPVWRTVREIRYLEDKRGPDAGRKED